MSLITFLSPARALRALLTVLPLLFLSACNGDKTPPQPETTAATTGAVSVPATVDGHATAAGQDQPAIPSPAPADSPRTLEKAVNPQFTVGNSQYMFDVSDHTREELLALLKRADEIATVSSNQFDQLDIALILHGPDIDWFARNNYEQNKELVDLAARLDALEVIDLKVCQKAMQHYGYLEEDIPTFIDRVPYAPDEMRRLEGSGYFRL